MFFYLMFDNFIMATPQSTVNTPTTHDYTIQNWSQNEGKTRPKKFSLEIHLLYRTSEKGENTKDKTSKLQYIYLQHSILN